MILIATPTRDVLNAGYVIDLVNLIQYYEDDFIQLAISRGSLLPNVRTNLVREAQSRGASHIMFIDSDMRFPKDVVHRLLVLGKKDIIGANCKHRSGDRVTAYRDGKQVESKGKYGIEEVDSVGTGVLLVDMKVFNRIPEPWFATPYDTSDGLFVGEDVYFCHQARQAGFKIFVDHDLSKAIAHEGSIELRV